jgi:ribose/xylose/arabinose/galactoside ABC-type transport system permease subunit
MGWVFKGDTFLFNPQRLFIIVLQVSVVGLLAIAVTQVIITGGIDLSSGSVLAISAMVAASLAQTPENTRAVYPALTNLPFIIPLLAGLCVGILAGMINGTLIARTGIPPFIATLGMMVAARGFARAYTGGQPVSMLSPQFTWIGSGYMPVVIFLATAVIFHIALKYTRYGKFTYAIGANPQAARVSGINVGRHLIVVYTIAGLLSGLAGVVTAARASTGQGDRYRRHEPYRRNWPHWGHGHRHGDSRHHDERIHLSRCRRLLPGHRQGRDHRCGSSRGHVSPAEAQEGLSVARPLPSQGLRHMCEGERRPGTAERRESALTKHRFPAAQTNLHPSVS